MIKKTKNYDMFIFREDNREKLNVEHINRLKESIKARNLLELRPICVNDKMEVIDGQHRLMAAKALGVDIYYEVQSSLSAMDIIALNTSKSWGINDYLNFYIKNGFVEYVKFADWMKKKNITIKIGLSIVIGASEQGRRLFKQGKFVFKEEGMEEEFDICWDTIELIKKLNGYCPFTLSARFWRALLTLVKHHNFDKEKWFINITRMNERIHPKATYRDYLRLFMDIHNWHNKIQVNLIEE